MQTKYIPTGPHVLIERLRPKSETDGGLFVPDSAQKPTNEGVVLEVGKGTYTKKGVLIPLECMIGDRVIWSKHQGTEIEKGIWMVREDDIVGRWPYHGAREDTVLPPDTF